MSQKIAGSVLIADPHQGLAEGIRTLLQSVFETVVMVADEPSLLDTASRLRPALAVVDLSLGQQQGLRWLTRIHEACPGLKIIVLSVHDERSVASAARAAGADGFVLKRRLADDLIPAAKAVIAGGTFPSMEAD